MREFKFRQWVPDEGMFYQTHGDLGAGCRDAEGNPIVEWSPFVIELPLGTFPDLKYTMQFTGLKDKNGKEIYEGDILERKQGKQTFRNEVIFMNGGFAIAFQTGSAFLSQLTLGIGKVIGNIYANPELLK